MQRTEMSEEEFRLLSNEVIPHLEAIKKLASDNRCEDGVRIYIGEDFVSMEGSGLAGWELKNYCNGGGYEMIFSKRVPLRGENENG